MPSSFSYVVEMVLPLCERMERGKNACFNPVPLLEKKACQCPSLYFLSCSGLDLKP